MRRKYIPPTFYSVMLDTDAVVCGSVGYIDVGGTTNSYEDSSGTIGVGGGTTADDYDAAGYRSSWHEYEGK